jgi:WD40 repeat protein
MGLLAVGLFLAPMARAQQPAPERSAARVIELAPAAANEVTPVISSLALDPSGKLLAAVGDDHLVRVFDADSGKLLHRWASHADWVKASAFRPGGTMLATSGADHRICLWNITASSQPRYLSEALQVIYAIAYSPDGRLLAAGGFADTVWVFDADQGRLVHEFAAPGNDIRAIVFSPDGLRMAATGRNGVVRIWDAGSGQVVADTRLSRRRLCALAYSPDGRMLAVAGQQRNIRLLDAASAKPVADLPERPGEVLSLCFCGPDTLAAAGSGNVIHVWDVASQREQCQLVGHTGSITTMAYKPSVNTLISGSYDTTVRLWDMSKRSDEKMTRR